MTDDQDIPEGKVVVLDSKNPLVKILIQAQRSGWIRRQSAKLGAYLAVGATGWFAAHGLQDLGPTIAMGIAALTIACLESAASWAIFKLGKAREVQALTMPKPETMKEAKAVVIELSDKEAGPPVVPVAMAKLLLLGFFLSASCGHAQPYVPQTEARRVGPADKSPPPDWWTTINESIKKKLAEPRTQ